MLVCAHTSAIIHTSSFSNADETVPVSAPSAAADRVRAGARPQSACALIHALSALRLPTVWISFASCHGSGVRPNLLARSSASKEANSSGGTGSAEKRLNSWTAAEQQGPLVQPKQLTTVPLPCAIEDINNSEMQAFFASGV